MSNPIEELLDYSRAGLAIQEIDRTLASKRRGWPPQPGLCLFPVAEGLLGQRRQRRDRIARSNSPPRIQVLVLRLPVRERAPGND